MLEDARKVSACYGKHGYSNKGIADEVIARMKRRGTVTGRRKLNSYKCRYCGLWHIGTTIIPKRRR